MYMERKKTTEQICEEIKEDLYKMKQETALIKLDLKIIIAKLETKEQKKEEINTGWTIFSPLRF